MIKIIALFDLEYIKKGEVVKCSGFIWNNLQGFIFINGIFYNKSNFLEIWEWRSQRIDKILNND